MLTNHALRVFLQFFVEPKVCIHNKNGCKCSYLMLCLTPEYLKYFLLSSRSVDLLSHKILLSQNNDHNSTIIADNTNQPKILADLLISRSFIVQISKITNDHKDKEKNNMVINATDKEKKYKKSQKNSWILRFNGEDISVLCFTLLAFREILEVVRIDSIDFEMTSNGKRLVKLFEILKKFKVKMSTNIPSLCRAISKEKLWYCNKYYKLVHSTDFDWNNFTNNSINNDTDKEVCSKALISVNIPWKCRLSNNLKLNDSYIKPYLEPLLSQDRIYEIYGGVYLEDILSTETTTTLSCLHKLTCWIKLFDQCNNYIEISQQNVFKTKIDFLLKLAPNINEIDIMALSSHLEITDLNSQFDKAITYIYQTFENILDALSSVPHSTLLIMVYLLVPKDLTIDWTVFCKTQMAKAKSIINNIAPSFESSPNDNNVNSNVIVDQKGHGILHIAKGGMPKTSLSICLDSGVAEEHAVIRRPHIFEYHLLQ